MEMTPKQEALASKPEEMPDKLLELLDKYTTSQIGEWILWWHKTYGARFELLDDDINAHKKKEKADIKEIDRQRKLRAIETLQGQIDRMKEELEKEKKETPPLEDHL